MIEIVPGPSAWGDGSRPYRRGDQGWQTAVLQQTLNGFGNRLALDGDFGPRPRPSPAPSSPTAT